MSGRERLDRYLSDLRRRLRIHIYVQAAAVCALSVLLITAASEDDEVSPEVCRPRPSSGLVASGRASPTP